MRFRKRLFPSTVMKWRRELSKRLSIVGCRLSPCLLLAKSVFERMSLPAEMNHGVVATSFSLLVSQVALSLCRPIDRSPCRSFLISFLFLIGYWLLGIGYWLLGIRNWILVISSSKYTSMLSRWCGFAICTF